MKFRLRPLIAALCTTTSCGVSIAAPAPSVPASSPEIVINTRTIIIENGVVVENSSGAPVSDVLLAQAGGDGIKKEVKIITSGPGPGLHALPGLGALMSSAMAEAYAGAEHGNFGKTVKNAPYSAEVITESNQPLPDGNQISKRTATMMFRDNAGRTRQETRDAKGDVKTINIHDSVEGTRYTLSPSAKTATKISRASQDKDLEKHIAEITEKARAMAKNGKATIVEHPGPGQEIIVKRIELPPQEGKSDGKKEVREEVKINIVRSGEPGAAGVHAFNFSDGDIGRAVGESIRLGPIGMTFQDSKWSAKSTTTQLGTKEFEGVRADGKAVSYTIPAGEIGNKNPITVSTETWYSPDLQATVYSKHSDPRVGETIYRLANIKRGQQPAMLFSVPEGYAVKELPGIRFSTKSN